MTSLTCQNTWFSWKLAVSHIDEPKRKVTAGAELGVCVDEDAAGGGGGLFGDQ